MTLSSAKQNLNDLKWCTDRERRLVSNPDDRNSTEKTSNEAKGVVKRVDFERVQIQNGGRTEMQFNDNVFIKCNAFYRRKFIQTMHLCK